MEKNPLKKLIDIAQHAGQLVLSIYNQSAYQVVKKEGNSPVTTADIVSHLFICKSLKAIYPNIPILSEESSTEYCYDTRKNWTSFFLVDPLDGTKEFIQRNDEFSINIALIKQDKPIVGLIHAPALGITYYAEENKGAYKITNNKIIPLYPRSSNNGKIDVLTTRSHLCLKTQVFLDELKAQGNEVTITARGSALKFGLIAEGCAAIYPRLGPTMEWDTAAGQVIVNEVKKQVVVFDSKEQLKYNKKNLVNPAFIVK